ncbi:hypothetical protein NG99_06830 [Erwinia typographi]|uniref:Lipoprotein n=1 Tax=Erwinia typographi TaxID=371042 RepID=A0A0A3Z7M2_9GAMM|nr:DUF6515 family protein [Erwinia typographi]KGT94855.1 hypothetical protein NG99_06830 [Erwinia typographi]
MKKVMSALLALTLLSPTLALAHPGGWGPGPGPGWHHGGGPDRLSFLPEAAAAVLIGGLTYYALNGNYYQRQNDNTYVVVQPPLERVSGDMRALDYNGERFYVQDGHYYRRDIDGRFLEVPRPPGL